MSGVEPLDVAWRLLLAVAARRRLGRLPSARATLWLADDGELVVVPDPDADDIARAQLVRHADARLVAGEALTAAQREFVEPYLPLLAAGPERPVVLAHLGQSVDGCIATASGDADVVTGRADFVHMHRLRALSDAVVVGGGTVASDDPSLTTRLVAGASPVRVVVDPAGRLDPGCQVFVDGLAQTLHVLDAFRTGRDATAPDGAGVPRPAAHVERVRAGDGTAPMSASAVLGALRARALHAVFVEGGGITVTRWIEAGLVARLHLVVAPVLVGAGRPALQLPGAARMRDSRRPPCRLYRLGQDILWDFDLTADDGAVPAASPLEDEVENGADAHDDTPRRLT